MGKSRKSQAASAGPSEEAGGGRGERAVRADGGVFRHIATDSSCRRHVRASVHPSIKASALVPPPRALKYYVRRYECGHHFTFIADVQATQQHTKTSFVFVCPPPPPPPRPAPPPAALCGTKRTRYKHRNYKTNLNRRSGMGRGVGVEKTVSFLNIAMVSNGAFCLSIKQRK